MDVVGCLGCDLAAERRYPPGGRVYETSWWIVNHVIGPMNLGTLVVSPREHIVALVDLDDEAARELGYLLRSAARAVQLILEPEQTYVGLRSHGAEGRKHLHFLVQPVTSEVIEQYGGLRGEQLHARMLSGAEEPDRGDVELFCEQARDMFALVSLSEPDY